MHLGVQACEVADLAIAFNLGSGADQNTIADICILANRDIVPQLDLLAKPGT